MSEAYVLELKPDTRELERDIQKRERDIDNLARKAADISFGGDNGPGRSLTADRSGGGRRGGLTDGYARLSQAEDRLYKAEREERLSGYRTTLRAERLDVARAQRQVEREDKLLTPDEPKAPKSMADRLSSALYTSRIGSGGLMPLVGKLGEVFGETGMGVAAGLYAGDQAYQSGSASRHDLGSAYWRGGGSNAETASVSSVGRFLGRSAEDSAGAAEAFGSALHGSTFGAGYFRSKGFVDFGGLTTDKDTNYIGAARALANEPDRNLATRVARDTGLQSELWLRDLNPREREEVFGGMNDNQSGSGRRSEAEYQLRKTEVSSFFDSRLRNFANHPLQSINNLTGVSTLLDKYNIDDGPVFNSIKAGFENAVLPSGTIDFARRLFTGDLDGSHAPLNGGSGQSTESSHGKGGNGISYRTKSGIVGGGQRVNASISPWMKAQQFDQNAERYGQYMGGYL